MKLEEKRDLKMNQYGPNALKKETKKNQKVIKNEIELEFLEQEEKEKAILAKYNKDPDDDDEEDP